MHAQRLAEYPTRLSFHFFSNKMLRTPTGLKVILNVNEDDDDDDDDDDDSVQFSSVIQWS